MLERTREERNSRLNQGVMHTFRPLETANQLREEPEYAANGRNGLTLVKGPEMRVVVMVVRSGGGLAEHHAPGPITVQVLEGEIRFSSGDEVVNLREGDLLALPSRQPHAVEAVRDSTFLLTIAPESDQGSEL